MKQCKNPTCETKGTLLRLDAFAKHLTNPDGRENVCKKCRNLDKARRWGKVSPGTLRSRLEKSAKVHFSAPRNRIDEIGERAKRNPQW